MFRLSSVQRRKILKEAGFLPYLGGKNPSNPIMPEPIPDGSIGHDAGLDDSQPGNGSEEPEDDQPRTEPEDILNKIIEVIKLLVGEGYPEQEIRQEALKILKSYNP